MSAKPKPEITEADLQVSMRWLEAMHVLVAVRDYGNSRGLVRILYSDDDAHQAVIDGFTIYSPTDMYMYVTLSEHDRGVLHSFKERFGGTVEWRETG